MTNLQTAAPAGLTSHWVLTPQGEGLHCPAAHPTRAPNHTNKISIEKYLDSLKQKQGLLVWGEQGCKQELAVGAGAISYAPDIHNLVSTPPPFLPNSPLGMRGGGWVGHFIAIKVNVMLKLFIIVYILV